MAPITSSPKRVCKIWDGITIIKISQKKGKTSGFRAILKFLRPGRRVRSASYGLGPEKRSGGSGSPRRAKPEVAGARGSRVKNGFLWAKWVHPMIAMALPLRNLLTGKRGGSRLISHFSAFILK
jgi:hypothetical protein